MASITYPYYLDNVVLSAGCYRVRTAISYNNALLNDHTTQLNVSSQQATLHPNGTGNARSANQSVGKLPLPLIAGGAVLLVVVVVVLLLLLRRGRRHQHERARARAKLNRLIEPLEQEEDTEVVSPWRSMRR